MEKTMADLFGERMVSDVFDGNKSADELATYIDANWRKCESPVKFPENPSQPAEYIPVTWFLFSDRSVALYNGGCGYADKSSFGLPLVGMIDGPRIEV